MKVITLCGSLRFKDEMMKVALELELQGNCVLTPIYPISDDKDAFTEEEAEMLGDMHRCRIDLSDAVYIVNKDGYIGSSVKAEIEYAKSKNKEIIYLENKKEN